LDEGKEVGIKLLFVGIREAMGRSGIDEKLCSFHEFRRSSAGSIDRHDLIVVSVNNKSGHIDLFQVFREICFRERLDAIVGLL
jgi:hypothetical protein